MTHKQGKKKRQPTYTISEEAQMLNILEKDLKSALTNDGERTK